MMPKKLQNYIFTHALNPVILNPCTGNVLATPVNQDYNPDSGKN